jgi:putative FmdB family regulatory protein
MPLYEYECFVCSCRFERIQKTSAKPVSECPSCGGAVRRLLGVPALQFKGAGWYVTDYGKGTGGRAGEKPATADTGATAEKANSTESTPPKTEASPKKEVKASGSAS